MPATVAIVGASGGIGAALLAAFFARDDVTDIHATFHRTEPDSKSKVIPDGGQSCQIHWSSLDVRDEAAIEQWVVSLGKIDWLINCVGMLHNDKHGPEKTVRQLNPEHFIDSMALNCLPSLLLGKYARVALKTIDWVAGTAIEPPRLL